MGDEGQRLYEESSSKQDDKMTSTWTFFEGIVESHINPRIFLDKRHTILKERHESIDHGRYVAAENTYYYVSTMTPMMTP